MSWIKTSVFSASLLAVMLLVLYTPSLENQTYQAWKQDFAMNFDSATNTYRSLIFKKNVDQIEMHNSNPENTYQKGLNGFSHLSVEEFSHLYLNRYYQETKEGQISYQVETNKRSLNIVADVDWQALGKVSAVKNQGICDAGYAFSSVSLAESFYMIQGNNYTLSEQQLIDCAEKYTTFGCQGGSRNGSIQYIRENGLNLEKDYPFKGTKSACLKPDGGPYKPLFQFKEYVGCDAIAKGLTVSPLTVAVNAKDWITYRSGIYDGCTSNEVNHDIFLAGVTLQNWKLKNSWGLRWGEFGYIRLKLGNTCGVCQKPAFGFQ